MPELPEVETVKRGLAPVLEGQRIVGVELRRKDLRFPFPQRFAARLEGHTVVSLTRRAKYILAHLSSGELLILHLGMTGRFTVVDPRGPTRNLGDFYFASAHVDGPHDHVVFHLERDVKVIYTDPRRFGMMDLATADEGQSHKLLRDIGIEPLGNELSGAFLAERFRDKAAPMKAALLDQSIIAGLGNIYVCEALFRAGISPKRKAGALVKAKSHDARLDALAQHIREILQEAILAGGSTLQDYQGVDGARGEFQQRFQVYDREGEACVTCSSQVKRIVQSGRSSFYCPVCQK